MSLSPQFTTKNSIVICDYCRTLSQRSTTPLRPLVNNQQKSQCSLSLRIIKLFLQSRYHQPKAKSHHLYSLIKNYKHKTPRNILNRSLLLLNLQIDLVVRNTPPLYPIINNHIPTYQIQAQAHQAQKEQQQQPENTQTLLSYSGFIANETLQHSTFRIAPSGAPQLETQPNNFANTSATHCLELPRLIHTVSNINERLQDISFFSDSSNTEQIRSQFSSPTPSKFKNKPVNTHQD